MLTNNITIKPRDLLKQYKSHLIRNVAEAFSKSF